MQAPLLYRLYVGLTVLLVPFASFLVMRKLRRAGVTVPRTHEVIGHATEPRVGAGPLVWFHAASVGESLSVLALITRMGDMLPRAHFLITSGTPTSAELVARKLPPRTVHQFAPLDAPGPLGRFLKHWRPAAAIFVESEIWPQMLRRTRARGTRMALVNARLSESSRKGWQKYPATAAYVLEVFDLILSQNDAMAQAMVEMHAPADRVARGINLKSLSEPLGTDPATLAQVRAALQGRAIWVAASTHPGEEDQVLEAHVQLRATHPDLALILVPRHPVRGAEVAKLIEKRGLSFAQRSAGELPRAGEAVYLADTLGELGNWYALTDIVFLGGSLKPIGGHNPFEVAQAGAAVLSGPHVFNFEETFREMHRERAVVTVVDAVDLRTQVARLLDDPQACTAAVLAAGRVVEGKASQLDTIAQRLIRALELEA
jgi:3-deoxy-D-manno-octulosonic-acid transferase